MKSKAKKDKQQDAVHDMQRIAPESIPAQFPRETLTLMVIDKSGVGWIKTITLSQARVGGYMRRCSDMQVVA